MDKPLKIWYCDVCGKQIDAIEKGYVIWRSGSGQKYRDFKIIHKSKCDQKSTHPASAALEDFLGENGLVYLQTFLSIGPIKHLLGQGSHCSVSDLDEFVDFMRRVQTPYYEEARRYFSKRRVLEHFSDSNEYGPYIPEQLREIIQTHGSNDDE